MDYFLSIWYFSKSFFDFMVFFGFWGGGFSYRIFMVVSSIRLF